jgi:hypothetical protein
LQALENFSDADFRTAILRALRLLAILTAAAVPLLWWKFGWQTALLLFIGSAISGSGLWEWLRLMTAVMARMDVGGEAKPMAWLLIGFFLRLGLTIVVLYGSLKLLNGSIYALAAGLGLGIFALTTEGLRLVKAWTV